MTHVFISYSKENRDFAYQVKEVVEKAGFDTWIDRQRLKPGKKWRSEIDRGIHDSFALIVIMTKAAKESEYVTYEWSYALGSEIGNGEGVIPILLDSIELHPRLDELQHLDFRGHVTHWDALIERLNEIKESYLKTKKVSSPKKDIEPHIDELIADLRHDAIGIRVQCINTLGALQEVRSVPDLLRTLFDVESTVRQASALSLGQIGSKLAVAGLIRTLKDDYYFVRAAAAEALGEIGDTSALAVLKKSLHDANTLVRASAVEALGKLRSDDALEELANLLNDRDHIYDTNQRVCDVVISTLKMIGTEKALTILQNYNEVYVPDELDIYTSSDDIPF